MQFNINLKIVSFFLAITAVGVLVLIATKPRKLVDSDQSYKVIETTSSSNYLEEAQARREQMLEQQEDLDRERKLLSEKENSVECKFWKQQKGVSSEAKVDEKIVEFCTLASSDKSVAGADASEIAASPRVD